MRCWSSAGALIAALAILAGCRGRSEGVPRSLRVIFTGETMGELEPCDCAGEMAGGLPARGGYLERQSGPYLLVDAGCMGNGAREFEILRAEATLRAMKHMGYHAANVGENELWLGRDGLRRLAEIGVPLVSANVQDEAGAPAVLSHRIVDVGGVTVAITGLVARDGTSPGPGLRVENPLEAAARILPGLRGRAQALVVLADLPSSAIEDLAAAYPEITLILARGRGDSRLPERVNRSVVASVSGEARFAGDLTLRWGTDRPLLIEKGEAILLDGRFPESEAIRRIAIDSYKDAVRGKTFDIAEPRPGWTRIRPIQPEPGNGYVGSEACRTCHARSYATWKESRHAAALESLIHTGYEWSPECIVCHVVGYGAADGYVSKKATPHLASVGCESCHGPGKALLSGACKGIARRGGEATCRECHAPKRHPDFVYADDWAEIAHVEARSP